MRMFTYGRNSVLVSFSTALRTTVGLFTNFTTCDKFRILLAQKKKETMDLD